MTALQAVVFGLVQGLTELFPVSSVGHGVLLPAMLGWHIDQESPTFLPFLVVLHLGTALALLAYFWREWWQLIGGALIAHDALAQRHRRVFWLLVIGTIPAVIFGGLLEKRLALLFGAPTVAAVMLLVNAALLFWGDRRLRRAGTWRADELKPVQALGIGVWQSTALIPGISRSGAAMVGGLGAGLNNEEAARFSFLLATPVILGAGVLEVPKLLQHGTGGQMGVALLGGLVAAVAAYVSTAILMRYFRRREVNALAPFAVYCLVVGVAALVILHH